MLCGIGLAARFTLRPPFVARRTVLLVLLLDARSTLFCHCFGQFLLLRFDRFGELLPFFRAHG